MQPDGRSGSFSTSREARGDLGFRPPMTDALYYPQEMEIGYQMGGAASSSFTSNEPRLLPPKQAGPDYDGAYLDKTTGSVYIEPSLDRLPPVKGDNPGPGQYNPLVDEGMFGDY